MLQTINDAIVAILDVPLGPLLALPRDVALLVVALVTAGVLTFIRWAATDQSWLRRAKADRARQKQFIRAAKTADDRAAVTRHRATIARIGMRSMVAEWRPLLLSLLPVGMLAVWGYARLGYLPLPANEPIEIKAYFSPVAIGEIVHAVPQSDLEAPSGWVQRIVVDPSIDTSKDATAKVNGLAMWTLDAPRRPEPYTIDFRHAGRTYQKQLLADDRRYSPPLEAYDGPLRAIEIVMQRYQPLGVIPGWDALYIDPWLIGYLLLAVPGVLILRKLFGVL